MYKNYKFHRKIKAYRKPITNLAISDLFIEAGEAATVFIETTVQLVDLQTLFRNGLVLVLCKLRHLLAQ